LFQTELCHQNLYFSATQLLLGPLNLIPNIQVYNGGPLVLDETLFIYLQMVQRLVKRVMFCLFSLYDLIRRG
jgi:hypothetical protein